MFEEYIDRLSTDDRKQLEIKLLEIEAKSHKASKVECFSDLFDWLVVALTRQQSATNLDDFHRFLVEDVSRTLYGVALSKSWVPNVQTRSYTVYSEYIHGERAKEMNARNRDVFRLATVEEMTHAYWSSRVPEWKRRYLSGVLRTSSGGRRSSYSGSDEAVFKTIGRDALGEMTNSEIGKKFRTTLKPPLPKPGSEALRASLNRIRKHHGLPTSEQINAQRKGSSVIAKSKQTKKPGQRRNR